MRPSFYDGTSNPDIMERWIWEIIKKMNFLNIPLCFRVRLTAYKLSGEVDY